MCRTQRRRRSLGFRTFKRTIPKSLVPPSTFPSLTPALGATEVRTLAESNHTSLKSLHASVSSSLCLLSVCPSRAHRFPSCSDRHPPGGGSHCVRQETPPPRASCTSAGCRGNSVQITGTTAPRKIRSRSQESQVTERGFGELMLV